MSFLVKLSGIQDRVTSSTHHAPIVCIIQVGSGSLDGVGSGESASLEGSSALVITTCAGQACSTFPCRRAEQIHSVCCGGDEREMKRTRFDRSLRSVDGHARFEKLSRSMLLGERTCRVYPGDVRDQVTRDRTHRRARSLVRSPEQFP